MKKMIKFVPEAFLRLGSFLLRQRARLFAGAELLILSFLLLCLASEKTGGTISAALFSGDFFSVFSRENQADGSGKKDFIKWVDFTVPCEAMTQAFRYDVATCQEDIHLNWIDLLAFLGSRYGGDFSRYKASDMERLADRLKNGASLDELTKEMQHFRYYQEAYSAVLGGLVGFYDIEIPASQAPAFALEGGFDSRPGGSDSRPESSGSRPEEPFAEQKVWVTKYGLKAFHPLAKNFPYSHYDDFGVSRSYGFRRQHLGHDMMGQTGTPVTAVESGVVEAIGWNQYGGWRLGIRSFDQKRYYYYAHLRKDYPYQSNLKEGSVVTAGDVIGYMGRTGYSATENTNNIDEPHLHFGIQLIFDESQKEGNHEIWISGYEIVKFLSINRSECVKVPGTKEWARVYQMKDPLVDRGAS